VIDMQCEQRVLSSIERIREKEVEECDITKKTLNSENKF